MRNLIKELESKNISISLVNDKIVLNYDAEIDERLVERIKDNKEKLIKFLLKYSKTNEYEEIKTIEKKPNYPLSDGQNRLWVLSQFGAGAVAYNLPSSNILNGVYDIQRLTKAIHAVINRHEILRTVFKFDEHGEIRQWVLPISALDFDINFEDYRTLSNPIEEAKSYVSSDSKLPFDLEQGPLFRISLLRLSEESYMIYYNMHHIIGDEHSTQVLKRDVMSFYKAFETEDFSIIPDELRVHYKDYTIWVEEKLKNEKFSNQIELWKIIFEDGITKVKFPFEKERPDRFTYTGNGLYFNLGNTLKSGLEEITALNKGSMYITLLFFIKSIINKYIGNGKVIVGSSFSTRMHSDLTDQIGFYINNLPIVTTIRDDLILKSLYELIKSSALNVKENSLYPLEKLMDEVKYKHNSTYSGMFNILVDYHDNKQNDKTLLNKEEALSYSGCKNNIPSKFDISFEFSDIGDDMICYIIYNNSLYDIHQIELFKERFITLIKLVVENLKNFDTIKLKDLLVDYHDLNTDCESENELFSVDENF